MRVWTYKGSGADLAEIYGTNDATLEAGDVVALDPAMKAGVQKSTKAYDSTAVGVISTAPGMIIGTIEDSGATGALVALSGRVPVKVNMENGPIKKGDYLTPSTTPGVAMKSTKAGIVIGQAMTEYADPDAPGLVVAFIKSGPSNGSKLAQVLPGLTLDDRPWLLVSDIDTTDAEDGASPPDGTVSSDAPAVATSADIAKQALLYFLTNKEQLAAQTEVSEILADRISAGLEVITPTLVADDVQTNTIRGSSGNTIGLVLDADANS